MALALVNLPMRYQFTTQGIACNNVLFRKWKEFEYVRYRGAKVTLVPRKGFGALPLVVLASRHDEVLPYFQRFLHVRYEAPPKFLERSVMLWLRRRLSLIALLALFSVSLVFLLAACGEGADPSGLNSANQSNLTGVSANGTPTTQQQLNTAKSNEPFAYNLAIIVDENRLGVNFVWTLVTGYLVMFMQAGFALVETGLCRAKNAGHTMAMNFMIYGLGMIGYYICGFAFQFGGVGLVGIPNLGGLSALSKELAIPIGGTSWGIIGYKGFFLTDGSYDVGVAVMFLFQMVFMDTTATIPTGAMAERWKWSAFCVYGLFVSTLVYPVFGNWAWGGGWLSQLGAIGLGKGYIDFAGMGNGLLAGLVAITAPSGYVSPVSASIIGAVAGVIVVVAAGFIDKVLKVDDPVGAIAVHGFNGLWGQLSVGLFADGLANY